MPSSRRGSDEAATTAAGTAYPADARTRLAVSAAIALQVVEIIQRPDIHNERILDLLHGAAQGDDLTRSSPTAVGEVKKAVARIRLDLAFDDPSEPVRPLRWLSQRFSTRGATAWRSRR